MGRGGETWLMLVVLVLATTCEAQLSPTFYNITCPKALSTIRKVISREVFKERRMAASLLRLHFHDALFSPTIQSEKYARNNANSVRGFDVIDKIKAAVEKTCPGVVSCADILAVAARDATVLTGGPSWKVKLGRRDSTTAYKNIVDIDLPAFNDSLPVIISLSRRKDLAQERWVYSNNSNMIDAGYAFARQRDCPLTSSPYTDNKKLANLDYVTPFSFDNNYFKNLILKKGLLESDQALYNGGSTDSIVLEYSANTTIFRSDFASAMIKMGDILPLNGSAG
ncbi:lignin-forming anionic peroxidase-like [Senna tora]|uniref:Peroxidase n=1 Tax=Senna tora TaxID=362788 RepID=A0A834T0F9_9FABA|nr:lignin-forming anionic peroxidase-like [Senna tora]